MGNLSSHFALRSCHLQLNKITVNFLWWCVLRDTFWLEYQVLSLLFQNKEVLCGHFECNIAFSSEWCSYYSKLLGAVIVVTALCSIFGKKWIFLFLIHKNQRRLCTKVQRSVHYDPSPLRALDTLALSDSTSTS